MYLDAYTGEEEYQTEDGEWIVNAVRDFIGWVGGLFSGSGYPKPLPAPLEYSPSEVAAKLVRYPAVATEIRSLIARQGHSPCSWPVDPRTTPACGGTGPPSPSRYDTPEKLARLALWYGNGTGDDLSNNEDAIRQLVIRSMLAGSILPPKDTNPDEPDYIDIIVSTAASEGREAAEAVAADLASGIYASIPQSWRDAIEKGVREYAQKRAGEGIRANIGNVVMVGVGGFIIWQLIQAGRS